MQDDNLKSLGIPADKPEGHGWSNTQPVVGIPAATATQYSDNNEDDK